MQVSPETEENGNAQEKIAAVDALVYDRTGNILEHSQWVVRERPVTLYLNSREVVTLLCAGVHLDELAIGFFHAEGFITSLDDLEGIAVDEEQGKVEISTRNKDTSLIDRLWMKRTISSGCGKGSVFYHSLDALLSKPVESSLVVTPEQLVERVEDVNRLSETYKKTHGVHNTALASPDELLLFRDDIGRHNAVDMIVGHTFLNGLSLSDKLIITTGRLTSEILIKSAKIGIPVLVSRNTATSLSVEIARLLNITLIGFARAGKFTIYSGFERVARG